MTILRLYAENGYRAGFWVQHRNWNNVCALVHSVGGLRCGKPADRAARHHRCGIVFHCFDVRSGRPIEVGPWLDQSADRNFERIAEPFWCHGRFQTFEPAGKG